ncbi:hypothetical protein ACFPLB_16475 [Aquamicrobium segne]|uniref:Antifreeze protein n=1 Tax=Aquamicrobium segne TaxID=469547 RepID=A0ABW0H319_9HYPH
MLKMIKTAVLSALIGLGGIAALPAAAQADALYINFSGGNAGYGIQVNHRAPARHHNWRPHNNRHQTCNARTAVNKAERMGLRRARVVDSNRRIVRVVGRKFNRPATVTFANQRGCPTLYR